MNKADIRILLVEDEPIVRTGLKLMLKQAGYSVAGEANSGEKAIDLADTIKPDLIIMDINLPKLNGLAAIEQINKETVTPCIIITGYRNREYSDRAGKAGVFAFLQKPIDEYELMSTIQIVLKRSSELSEAKSSAEEARAEAEQARDEAEQARDEARQAKDAAEKARIALEERKLVERAKGILMDQFSVDEASAMRALQKKARDKNLRLAECARQIIAAKELLS